MRKSTRQNIELKKGFWRGKAKANPKYAKLAEQEIFKLENEARSLNNFKK